MEDLQIFLANSPVFRHFPAEQLAEILPLLERNSYAAGTVILRQGDHSDAIYFLLSGRLAVRIQRGQTRETVAHLNPPDVFGELSFVTGKPCVADVEVIVDAETVRLRKDAMATLSLDRDAILSGLITPIATRLQSTVSRGTRTAEMPVVLLRNHPHWEAPASFAAELTRSLGRQTGRQTLLVNIGADQDQDIQEMGGQAAQCGLARASDLQDLRVRVADQLTRWKSRFTNVILNPIGGDFGVLESIQSLANFTGEMLGPGDSVPAEAAERSFAIQSAVAPTLPFLSGSRQLIYEAADSEAAYLSGATVTPNFRRTVDSIARAIARIQVGLALGGGAAWGWAHIGILRVLEKAHVPIDVVSGCSMGSVIGTLYASGRSTDELEQIALYWRTRVRRFIEWRFWRMSLINENAAKKAFRTYFGERQVNQTATPFWANAVDVATGQEVTIRTGGLVECVRASISLPGLLPPYNSSPHVLVDAAIMDPIPARLIREMGCNFAVAVNSMASPASTQIRSRYPFNAFEIMTRCMFMMGHAMGQARAEPAADVVFTPDLSGLSMLEFGRSPEIIERGVQAAEKHLPAILSGYERVRRQGLES
ncbi:MAG TPA: patatin-like phospholipase family protein [Bryobacteraceae bacterium]|nr:patatin-like phospholipase family protein [Bryobacteraceae bacterium]HXJ42319.1 patatin-like phospholipase family protein [Bryobacteraceae bacterium]